MNELSFTPKTELHVNARLHIETINIKKNRVRASAMYSSSDRCHPRATSQRCGPSASEAPQSNMPNQTISRRAVARPCAPLRRAHIPNLCPRICNVRLKRPSLSTAAPRRMSANHRAPSHAHGGPRPSAPSPSHPPSADTVANYGFATARSRVRLARMHQRATLETRLLTGSAQRARSSHAGCSRRAEGRAVRQTRAAGEDPFRKAPADGGGGGALAAAPAAAPRLARCEGPDRRCRRGLAAVQVLPGGEGEGLQCKKGEGGEGRVIAGGAAAAALQLIAVSVLAVRQAFSRCCELPDSLVIAALGIAGERSLWAQGLKGSGVSPEGNRGYSEVGCGVGEWGNWTDTGRSEVGIGWDVWVGEDAR
jgi:hypothetical protein